MEMERGEWILSDGVGIIALFKDNLGVHKARTIHSGTGVKT